jgi:2-oxoglutarate dehydrogenase E1 component
MNSLDPPPVAGDIATLLSGNNATWLETLYQRYLDDPDSVPPDWRATFARLPDVVAVPMAGTGTAAVTGSGQWTAESARKQAGVLRLINAYRTRGHQIARLDPLGLIEPEPVPDLTLEHNGLSRDDLDTQFDTGSFAAARRLPLREIVHLCDQVYCGPIGSEYMYITSTPEKRWIQARLETNPVFPPDSREERLRILERLTAAEGLEKYLHTRYVGQKRFSLEGSESLIPSLSEIIQRAGGGGVKEVVIGMAHRGRLNVLVNILGKAPSELFSEFEGRNNVSGSGDVKYHQGFSSDIVTPGGQVHLALSFNPSHLEIIDPVVEGSVRARQERRKDRERNTVLPVLIHGDAAFAGQGVVMETLNMSQARGFMTGGTVHLIVNNQIGFTTSNPVDARSTAYCTDVAKMVQAPIFHVNADDPDAVLLVTRMALDFRMEFRKDVVIDLVCYRRLGHNEADEPSVTQPLMYQRIKKHRTTRALYGERLLTEGVIARGDAERMATEYRDALDQGRVVAGQIIDPNKAKYMVDWKRFIGAEWTDPADTRVSVERLRALHERLVTMPDEFEVHARVKKILADRGRMAAGKLPMDWGFAEIMAYASLVEEGYTVRLTGQDSGRGTFFHRHATIHNQKDRDTHVPLRTIGDDPNRFLVINSLLSEEAVLGFEYGYATTDPDTLVIWEAQFGDFANGAQVVIDQFISSGEAKWQRLCGLTLLLPHGYEGQGPEHSSARLERYLQLCAEHNMQVCVPSTPAQMFHMLRRQMIRRLRRPLVVMTPKSLLRHKMSVSAIDELATGTFRNVIDETAAIPPANVTRVVLCSGKVYFDLFEERTIREQFDTALIRIEQLHPFPKDDLRAVLEQYANSRMLVWCQEEPENQGAWYQIQHHLRGCLEVGQTLVYAGRGASPSPAVGFYKVHLEQQMALVTAALTAGGDTREQPEKEQVRVHAS